MTDDDEKIFSAVEKIRTNVQDPALHENMDPEALYEILVARSTGWQLVWESIPTDSTFDALYMGEGRPIRAFLYNNNIFIHDETDGEWDFDNDLLEWMVDHPPFDPCSKVSDLYIYSRGIEDLKPWLLFQYITGIAVTSQGMGLNSLMGIGINDAVYLGRAVEAWGEYADVVHPYVELLLENGAID